LPIALTVTVLDHGMVNAFALPGGQIVIFRGLIDEAQSAEELAAVVAHEIGHVAARDPTRIALRSAGSIGILGLLFGDFAGGTAVLFLTEQLIQADYTREAEAAADSYAHQLLLAADLPPAALASLFERLDMQDPQLPMLQHFMSHPELGNRIEAARAATPAGREFAPLLSARQWADLQSVCRR
jgi:beta-barrel assembly-enhancing protease